MNKYQEMKQRHNEIIDNLPIVYVGNKADYEKMLAEYHVTSKNVGSKLTRVSVHGYCFNQNADMIRRAFDQMESELDSEIEYDSDGTGFIRDMFCFELCEHDYGYTRDLSEALEYLGYSPDAIMSSPALLNGLKLAAKDALEVYDAWESVAN